jgi:hypothetical protein
VEGKANQAIRSPKTDERDTQYYRGMLALADQLRGLQSPAIAALNMKTEVY